jgi:hypothetical protein
MAELIGEQKVIDIGEILNQVYIFLGLIGIAIAVFVLLAERK